MQLDQITNEFWDSNFEHAKCPHTVNKLSHNIAR